MKPEILIRIELSPKEAYDLWQQLGQIPSQYLQGSLADLDDMLGQMVKRIKIEEDEE